MRLDGVLVIHCGIGSAGANGTLTASAVVGNKTYDICAGRSFIWCCTVLKQQYIYIHNFVQGGQLSPPHILFPME